MTEPRKNVVPFDRPAAYWAARAKRHDTPAKLPSAAKLMRKALEKKADSGTALELGRIYMNMGCFTAAERMLLRAASLDGMNGGICFLIGCCALEQEDEYLAQQALEMCIRLDPESHWADQAQELLETHPWKAGETVKRGARSECLCMRARERLTHGDTEAAKAIVEKAWKRGKSSDAATLLGILEETKERQIALFRFAVKNLPGELRPRLLLARAYQESGRPMDALQQLLLAHPLCQTLGQAEFFCAAAWDTGHPELALNLIEERLAKNPFSVDDLRLRYLTLKRVNREEEAEKDLLRMLEIDPDDAAAQRYRRDENDLYPDEHRLIYLTLLSLPLRVMPRRLREGPLNRVLHLMVIGLQDELTEKEIYLFLPSLWKKLPRREKWAADDQDPAILLCISCFLLCQAGKNQAVGEMLRRMPGKKYLERKIRRYIALYNKGVNRTHALHQF